jgi:hypothetical protein
MPDRDTSSVAIDSDTVDAEFWALVLRDEEWLSAEFDEITEPAEVRVSPPRALVVAADQSSSGRRGPWEHGRGGDSRLGDTGRAPSQGRRRERSPPGDPRPPTNRARFDKA